MVGVGTITPAREVVTVLREPRARGDAEGATVWFARLGGQRAGSPAIGVGDRVGGGETIEVSGALVAIRIGGRDDRVGARNRD